MPTYNVKLTKKDQIANGTMAFHFEKPAGFEYRAGQFCDISHIDPSETDEEGNNREFSLAGSPDDNDLMIATRMRDSAFKRILKQMLVGSEMKLEGPFGDFTLHTTTATPAVFLIGGIGITPVRSMIAKATADKTAHHITLLYSNKTPGDAAFVPDFEGHAKANPRFTFVPVMTNVTPEQWKGETGYINQAMLQKYVADISAPRYYLSGPASMVTAMRKLLVDASVNEDNIKTEEFPGY